MNSMSPTSNASPMVPKSDEVMSPELRSRIAVLMEVGALLRARDNLSSIMEIEPASPTSSNASTIVPEDDETTNSSEAEAVSLLEVSSKSNCFIEKGAPPSSTASLEQIKESLLYGSLVPVVERLPLQ
ncbi:unnamed protein product [Orchesella dallaii]|uniref:Uncharacterized protein n=1 Tax=Orchesella dallaii TaxID=48710 RepID=A0ABP1Q258_9HEXA